MHVYSSNPYAKTDLSKIGHGYRNVCWVPGYRGNGGRETGHIVLFGYDTKNNPKTFKIPFCPSVKYEVGNRTREKGLYGRYVDTKYFDDTYDRKEWCESMERALEKSDKRILSCYSPEKEFLLSTFGKYVFGKDKDEGFNQQPIRVHFIDIEVAIENEFPEPEFAKYPINLITIYDTKDGKFHSWALSTQIHNTITDLPIELRKFEREDDLLHDYLEWHTNNYPDCIAGWNTRLFDLIYIVNRLQNVFGKKETKRYSPVGKYRTNIEDRSNYGKKFATVSGIANMDLLFLYRDKFKVKQALDGGYNLNNVALTEIDDAKMHYDGSMLDFYKSNFQKFWEYNVQDVNLVVKLDKKLNLISSARKITSFGCAPMDSIYGTISYVMSSLDIYSRNVANRIFLTYSKSSSRGMEVDQYQGAYVFPTQAGLYKQGITGIDFNSLYPSTARVLNLSPETLVGMLRKNDTDIDKDAMPYTLEYTNGEKQELDENAYKELFDKVCILSRNNAVFYKHEVRQGIFAKWCENFFVMRKSYKEKLAECNEKILKLKKSGKNSDNAELKELERLAEIYDVTQYALKILINSAYGTLGTTFSPIYDVRLAEAITLTGQFANRSTAEFLKEVFREKYNVSDDFDITISGDTDSVTGDMELDVEIDWSKINGKSGSEETDEQNLTDGVTK